MPIDQMSGIQIGFAGIPDYVPLKTAKDYQNYLTRLELFSKKIDQTIDLMKRGIETGWVHPKIILKLVPDQIKAQYNRPVPTTTDGSAVWGSFGQYDKVVAVTTSNQPYVPKTSGVGVAAIMVGASTVGGVTASLGGSIVHTDLTAGVVYEIGVSQINVASGTIYALYKNTQVT